MTSSLHKIDLLQILKKIKFPQKSLDDDYRYDILDGETLIHFHKAEIQCSQRIENKVHRVILRPPVYTLVFAMRGKLGASSVYSRLMGVKMSFLNYVLTKEDILRKHMARNMSEPQR